MNSVRLTVRSLDPAIDSRWDEFVRNSEGGTFYHLSGWRALFENVLNHRTYYLYCESDGEIEGVLPMTRVKSWLFGDALISSPFLVYGGVVASSDSAAEVLVSAGQDLANNLGVDYLELRNRVPSAGDWFVKNTQVTFRKTIDADSEANLMAIPRKQRAMIRKGIKAGLESEIDADAGRLFDLMLECKRNLGTPFFGRNWLESIKQEFGEAAEITTVTHKGRPVCSVMSFLFRDEVLPYYGGGGELARQMKGNDFMYWAVMERACERGLRIFDFGRSSIGSGAYHFKKHWGFEPEDLHYQISLVKADTVPDISPRNPRFDLLVKAWKKLPLGVAGLVGPPLARRLG